MIISNTKNREEKGEMESKDRGFIQMSVFRCEVRERRLGDEEEEEKKENRPFKGVNDIPSREETTNHLEKQFFPYLSHCVGWGVWVERNVILVAVWKVFIIRRVGSGRSCSLRRTSRGSTPSIIKSRRPSCVRIIIISRRRRIRVNCCIYA